MFLRKDKAARVRGFSLLRLSLESGHLFPAAGGGAGCPTAYLSNATARPAPTVLTLPPTEVVGDAAVTHFVSLKVNIFERVAGLVEERSDCTAHKPCCSTYNDKLKKRLSEAGVGHPDRQHRRC